MLNIPDNIKNLFKQDSVRKNFRVIFPNGEFRDLTNVDIESETVSLTESINSSAVIKFGLCESPVMEFVCHGLPNVKGKTIQCQLEVDVSSIPANERPEGVKTSQDVPYPYYVIPYGVYKVKTCKRDGDTDKRTIVAYNKLTYYDWNIFSTHQKLKLSYPCIVNDDFVYSPIKCFYEYFNDVNLIQNMTLSGLVPTGESSGGLYDTKFDIITPNNDIISFSLYHTDVESPTIFEYWENSMFDVYYDEDIDFSSLYSQGLDWALNIGLPTEKINNFRDIFTLISKAHMKYAQRTEVPNASHLYEDSQFVPLTVSHQHTLVYPYISNVEERQTKTEGSGTVTQINFIYLVVPSKIEIYKRDRYGNFIDGTLKSFDIIDTNKIHIYRYEDMQDDPIVVTKSIPRTIKKRIYVGYAYFDVYNAPLENTEETKNETKDVIESCIELWGLFGTFDRYGGFQFIDLTKKLQLYPSDTLYPAENLYPRAQRNLITQSMYSKVEYEDVPTRHYDRIECTWRDSNNVEHSCSYQIVDPDSLEWYDPDDYQQYNLSDNYFIKNGYFTEEVVQTILETLGEKIKDFQYYPANIEMRGLPYLEAGDELAVVTRMSGFTTFILRRTMNGIQELKDNIEAEM